MPTIETARMTVTKSSTGRNSSWVRRPAKTAFHGSSVNRRAVRSIGPRASSTEMQQSSSRKSARRMPQKSSPASLSNQNGQPKLMPLPL